MHSRVIFVFCTLAVFLFLASSSIAVAEKHHHLSRGGKLSNTAWLGAPHFQALSKRGRFVFRQAPYDHFYDGTNDDLDLQPEKRNWRL